MMTSKKQDINEELKDLVVTKMLIKKRKKADAQLEFREMFNKKIKRKQMRDYISKMNLVIGCKSLRGIMFVVALKDKI